MNEYEDFRLFCQQATTSQLAAIIDKERAAGRHEFAAIATAVMAGRPGGVMAYENWPKEQK